MHATSPVRVCDIGGWTDTWFARHGHVFSIAVQPGVAVRAAAYPRATRPDAVVVNAVDGTPALAVNTVLSGSLGNNLRVVFVAGVGTSAGAAQTITAYCASL